MHCHHHNDNNDRGIRAVEDVTRNMFHFAAHLNDRLVFRDFGPFSRLSKAQQEVSTLKFGVNIGACRVLLLLQ